VEGNKSDRDESLSWIRLDFREKGKEDERDVKKITGR